MNYKTKLKDITTFIFDYDGVISDGMIYVVDNQYDQVRNSDAKDGYALHQAIALDYRVVIISGGKGEAMQKRLNNIGVTEIYQAVRHKKSIYEQFMAENPEIKKENVMYMGDDIPDWEVMQMVGLSCCPADACVEIKGVADYVSPYSGGRGAVRDIIEQVMKVQGKWMSDKAFHW